MQLELVECLFSYPGVLENLARLSRQFASGRELHPQSERIGNLT